MDISKELNPEPPSQTRIPQITPIAKYTTGHTSTVNKLILIQNDTKYITCSTDKFIHIFNSSNHKLLRKLRGHIAYIVYIMMLTNGYLASCSRDRTIKLWNVMNGLCIQTLIGHTFWVAAIVEAPNAMLISGSWDMTIKVWNYNGNDSSPLQTVSDPKQGRVGWGSLCMIDKNSFAVGSVENINIYSMENNGSLTVKY